MNKTIAKSKKSDAARNRYIYYPDHLVRVPAPGDTPWGILAQLLREPLFQGVLPGIAGEFFRPARPRELEDESVGSFLRRRFGPAIADNLVSALMHGIYAGDIYRLSAKSLLPLPWHLEDAHGSVLGGVLSMLPGNVIMPDRDYRQAKLFRDVNPPRAYVDPVPGLKHASLYSFVGGIGTLVKALEDQCKGFDIFRLKTETHIRSLEFDPASQKVLVRLPRSAYHPNDISSGKCVGIDG